MEIFNLHDWPASAEKAIEIQMALKDRIIIESRFEKLEYLTAIDTAYDNDNNLIFAAAVTVRLPGFSIMERSQAALAATFPYLPALLGFREGPVILKALSQLQIDPDIIMFAGHGIAHPRSFGLASHMGLLTDKPSIGCARRYLCGDYRIPAPEKGSYTSLFVANVESGFVYRTKEKVKPMFISPGHKCSIHDSFEITSRCLTEYRMPEPLRLAHLYAAKCRQASEKSKSPAISTADLYSENTIDD